MYLTSTKQSFHQYRRIPTWVLKCNARIYIDRRVLHIPVDVGGSITKYTLAEQDNSSQALRTCLGFGATLYNAPNDLQI